MKQLNGMLFTFLGVLSACVAARAGEYPYPPAPGHEDLPVIFWAHYMPQVASGKIHCGGHVGGKLRAIRLFLNGNMEGQAEVDVPTYKRTHSAPVVGFSNIIKRKDGHSVGFSGAIDHIEIIGTGLTEAEVEALHTNGFPF